MIDHTGQKFGALTVISRAGTRNSQVLWCCRCLCGKFCDVVGSELRSGSTVTCGCKRTEKQQAQIARMHAANVKPNAPKEALLAQYKRSAQSNKRAFTLSDAEFFELIVGNCYWCGLPPQSENKTHRTPFLWNGIDRLDNSQGYTIANSVSCCAVCNRMKRDMEAKEFLNKIFLIHNHYVAGLATRGAIKIFGGV